MNLWSGFWILFPGIYQEFLHLVSYIACPCLLIQVEAESWTLLREDKKENVRNRLKAEFDSVAIPSARNFTQ